MGGASADPGRGFAPGAAPRYPGADTGARGFALGAGPRDMGVAVTGVIAAGLSDCARVRRRPGGRAAALHSDIRGGERLL